MSISLNDMTGLVKNLLDADAAVEAAEVALKVLKEKARYFREEAIPSAMHELGIKEYTLETGEKLRITQEVYLSIPKAMQTQAYAWLEDNGFGGLLKLSLGLEYGKGEKQLAVAMYESLVEQGLRPSLSEGVHSQTLKAFAKEQISAGKPFPIDLFGAMPVWVAKISKK